MIDTRRITALLTTLIRRLEMFDTSSAERLKLLVAAIEADATADISAWADADLYQMFPPTQIMDQYHSYLVRTTPGRHSRQRWTTPVQLLLLLLPFIVTTLSLARALMLYPNFLLAHARSGASSLLYGWQQGFDGHLPVWLSPSNVLLYDLLLVLLCTTFFLVRVGVSSRVRRNTQHSINQQEQALRGDLTEALSMATLYLAHYKNQLLVADNLTMIARRIDEMSRRLEDRFEQSVDSFDGMAQNVTQSFDGLTRTMSGTFSGLAEDVTTRYDDVSQQIMQRFSQITDHMQAQLQDGSKYLQEMGDLTSGVIQTAEQVREATRTLKESHGELIQHTGNLVTPAINLVQQQEQLITASTQAIQLLEDATRTMLELSKKQDRWGTDLRNILDTLDLTIERATELAFRPPESP